MNKQFTTVIIFLLGLSFSAYSQDDQLGKLLGKTLGDMGSKKKAKLDSVDFQFAISVNENSGLINVSQKGETVTRGLYKLTKSGSDRTPVEIARDTVDWATSLYEKRFYKMAESAFDDAKGYIEASNLTTDVSYLKCISNMALVYMAEGKMFEAQEMIDLALKSSAKLGTNTPAYIANLNSQAKIQQINGHYNESEKDFDQTLELVRTAFSENSLQYAIVLNNKAMLYQNVGRYDEAIALMKKAITTAEAAFKKSAKRSAFDGRRFQSNLAFMLQMAGKYPEAEAVFVEMKKSYEKNMAANNPDYAALLNQLALLYIETKRNDQVEPLLKKAQEIFKKRQSEQSPGYARATADLGVFYRITGRNGEAEPLLVKALTVREQVLGAKHPDYVRTQEELAILYWKMQQWEKAYSNYKPVMDQTIDFINKYFPPMSEAEKTKYWDITFPRFQRFYNFALSVAPSKPGIAEDIYDYQTATKALLLNATNKIKQSILKSGDKALIADYLSWLDKKETLARYYSLSKEELAEQKIDLGSLESEANKLERGLSSRSADFSSGYSTQKISFRQIRDVLADNEAVVEIIRVRNYDNAFTDDSKYIALVLTKGVQLPKMTILDNGNQLETRYAKYYRNAIQTKIEDAYSYDQYWARFDANLQGKKVVYVSPDGAYNQINLNTLKKPSGDFVINRYDITIVGNSKDLITLKATKPGAIQKTATLLGFPEYGGDNIAPLPGTKVEIDGVAKILKTAGYQVNQFTQQNASEKNLKSIKSPSLVHIATHGYFLQDGAFGVEAENATNNPLLRSGLMLANASKTISGAAKDIESNDNGILTAYEAMNLDLDNTKLIVLSACETGLGDVKNGEGVYGLQRAFLVAGADAMIMSLWKVDDAATQQLMTNFYTNWIKLGNKQKAFKQAQIQLMAKYKEPYYWGAFVMMGQ
jgi:CHAT domain-containing protein